MQSKGNIFRHLQEVMDAIQQHILLVLASPSLFNTNPVWVRVSFSGGCRAPEVLG